MPGSQNGKGVLLKTVGNPIPPLSSLSLFVSHITLGINEAMAFVPLVVLLSTLQIVTSLDEPAGGNSPLQLNFYAKTCPQAEQIVSQVVADAYQRNLTIAAGLIRLHFHDCFVRGCDASILLDETPGIDVVEKFSPANFKSIRGMEIIDEAKSRLEAACPGIVSCADILAFAARDAATNARLDSYGVPGGRRDGTRSSVAETIDLPAPFMSMDTLMAIFTKKGFSKEDMVVLSGAHSLGTAHCSNFYNRLYFFRPHTPQDPSLDPSYATYLKGVCPKPAAKPKGMEGTEVAMDAISPYTLDNAYYLGLETGRALLSSDQLLVDDPSTKTMVKTFHMNSKVWSDKFINAMIRMGEIDVLTGNQGEIRKNCRFVN